MVTRCWFIFDSAAEAELADLKETHKKALDKAKKENTKLKAKLLSASKSVEVETARDAPKEPLGEKKIEELQAENARLLEELSDLKARHLGNIRQDYFFPSRS